MRTKRKALKEAKKSGPAKVTPVAAPTGVLNNGVAQEDVSRLENEGGLSNKDAGVAAPIVKP